MCDPREFWPYTDAPPPSISIYDGVDRFLFDFGGSPREIQVAFVGFWLQAEYLNGGLCQFFANDTGVMAPEAVLVCRQLGVLDIAETVEKAMAWFGCPYPRERTDRVKMLDDFNGRDPRYISPFDEADDYLEPLMHVDGPGLDRAARYFISQRSG